MDHRCLETVWCEAVWKAVGGSCETVGPTSKPSGPLRSCQTDLQFQSLTVLNTIIHVYVKDILNPPIQFSRLGTQLSDG